MLTPRTTLARRVAAALDASPSRIPVLLGGCGSGRTVLLQQLRDRLGRTSAQYVDVERTATTPERFLRAVVKGTPFQFGDQAHTNARTAFETALQFVTRARTQAGEPASFLFDGFLELRTFESFPGLRRVVYEFVEGLAGSSNRFVLSSRYVTRSLKLLKDKTERFDIIHIPALTAEDALDIIGPTGTDQESDELARTVLGLSDGRPLYLCALAEELARHREGLRGDMLRGDLIRELGDRGSSSSGRADPGHAGAGGSDAIGALAALMAPEGRLARQCCFSYELRLHRARGYGALKAILEILAEEEGLTLTEISQRLNRTPGSTKDYLSWLEDVDLVASDHKRYSFTDPLMRVWVRLHCRADAPTEDDLAREVQSYAMPRVPRPVVVPVKAQEPAFAMAGGPSGIIEID